MYNMIHKDLLKNIPEKTFSLLHVEDKNEDITRSFSYERTEP